MCVLPSLKAKVQDAASTRLPADKDHALAMTSIRMQIEHAIVRFRLGTAPQPVQVYITGHIQGYK